MQCAQARQILPVMDLLLTMTDITDPSLWPPATPTPPAPAHRYTRTSPARPSKWKEPVLVFPTLAVLHNLMNIHSVRHAPGYTLMRSACTTDPKLIGSWLSFLHLHRICTIHVVVEHIAKAQSNSESSYRSCRTYAMTVFTGERIFVWHCICGHPYQRCG